MPDYCLHLHRSSEFKFPAQGSKNSFCKINDDDWTHFERAAWLQICSNGYTALDKVPIRASFIRDIIIDKPYADTSKINGIVIDNAVITGDLNLAGITFDGALSITHSIVQGNTNLSNSKFGKTVSFVGTHLLKGILANHATITGSLLLGKLDRVEPDHEPITLRNTVEIGIIKANSIHLDGSLNVFGARLGDYLDVHESRITGDLNLMNVIGHQILAYESNIGGQAVIVDCHLSPLKNISILIIR